VTTAKWEQYQIRGAADFYSDRIVNDSPVYLIPVGTLQHT